MEFSRVVVGESFLGGVPPTRLARPRIWADTGEFRWCSRSRVDTQFHTYSKSNSDTQEPVRLLKSFNDNISLLILAVTFCERLTAVQKRFERFFFYEKKWENHVRRNKYDVYSIDISGRTNKISGNWLCCCDLITDMARCCL